MTLPPSNLGRPPAPADILSIAALTYVSVAALGARWGGMAPGEVVDRCERHGFRFIAFGLSRADGQRRAYLLHDIERYERLRWKRRSEL